jgi:DNA mismatch endonuclease (patch repair protein)
MRANRRCNSKPELVLRSLLHARGLRFRVDFPLRVNGYPRPIRPDVVFTRAMCVVEWNGCWWHGCDDPACGDGPQPSVRNREYWLPKIQGNRERDTRKAAALEAAGWKVLSFWGHDDPVLAADLIGETVRYAAPRAEACDMPVSEAPNWQAAALAYQCRRRCP